VLLEGISFGITLIEVLDLPQSRLRNFKVIGLDRLGSGEMFSSNIN